MSMTGTGMGGVVHTALMNMNVGGGKTMGELLTAAQSTAVRENWDVICGAIVDYIHSNARITKTHLHDQQTGLPTLNESVE